nr:uncharacterized serine-rich protein C1E8.05-like [Ipomoea batatas]GMD93350.1 uncharacterized serine-rich protein C1E8.05-like [Ipomoea batatas]GME02149.1 uncharacterized serine-rich protein C1E8.05-like [Ipomoea batatas]
MAAPPSQFLLLICIIFFFLATSSRAGDAAQANSGTPNVVYSDQNAATSSQSTSLNVSPGPTSEAPSAVAGQETSGTGGGGGGATTGLDESYALSMSAMKKTMEDVNEGNLYKANVDVSAMASHADTCKECMRQVYGDDDPEFKKFEAWIDGVTDDCLNKITGLKKNP